MRVLLCNSSFGDRVGRYLRIVPPIMRLLRWMLNIPSLFELQVVSFPVYDLLQILLMPDVIHYRRELHLPYSWFAYVWIEVNELLFISLVVLIQYFDILIHGSVCLWHVLQHLIWFDFIPVNLMYLFQAMTVLGAAVCRIGPVSRIFGFVGAPLLNGLIGAIESGELVLRLRPRSLSIRAFFASLSCLYLHCVWSLGIDEWRLMLSRCFIHTSFWFAPGSDILDSHACSICIHVFHCRNVTILLDRLIIRLKYLLANVVIKFV